MLTGKEKEELILKYLPLVKSVAYKIYKRLPNSVDINDLVGYGILGLVEAVNKLDISKGGIAYIKLRIKGAIYDYLRSLDNLGKSLREKEKKIKRAIEELTSMTGKEPTDEEIARYLNVSIQDLQKDLEKIAFSNFLSLDELFSEGRSYEEFFPSNEDDPEEAVLKKDIREKLLQAVKELDYKEQLVLQLVFYEELPLQAIAEILNVSVARVSQIKLQAINKLKSKLSNMF